MNFASSNADNLFIVPSINFLPRPKFFCVMENWKKKIYFPLTRCVSKRVPEKTARLPIPIHRKNEIPKLVPLTTTKTKSRNKFLENVKFKSSNNVSTLLKVRINAIILDCKMYRNYSHLKVAGLARQAISPHFSCQTRQNTTRAILEDGNRRSARIPVRFLHEMIVVAIDNPIQIEIQFRWTLTAIVGRISLWRYSG